MFFFQLYKKLDQLKKAVIFHILYMYKNVQKEQFGLYSRRERLHFIPGHKQVSICSNRWLNEKKNDACYGRKGNSQISAVCFSNDLSLKLPGHYIKKSELKALLYVLTGGKPRFLCAFQQTL